MVISSTSQHLVAGTIGGFFSTGFLYPIELVKTRMQVINDGTEIYRSFTKSLRIVYSKEGIKGLYQGMTPALIASSGSWGGYFYFYELSKQRKLRYLQTLTTISNAKMELNVIDHLTSGIEAGVLLVFLFNPMWVVKTRLALQGAEQFSPNQIKYQGTIHAFRTILKEEGVTGFYKGLFPALLLTSHGAIQFAVYESMKSTYQNYYQEKSYQPDQQQQQQHQPIASATPAWLSMFTGGISKIIASTITYPYQLIKSKLQQREVIDILTKERVLRYTSTYDCMIKVWRSEGMIGFFRGVLPNALKVAPSSAITFLIYEETMKILKDL